MTTTHTAESIRALDGRLLDLLNPSELEAVKYYQEHGRKHGVTVLMVKKTIPVEDLGFNVAS